jgi:hypothetical protein
MADFSRLHLFAIEVVLLIPLGMRKITLLCALVALLISCEEPLPYQITTESRVLLDDENCLIDHRYPQLSGVPDSMTAMGLNRYLREALQLNQALAECLETEIEGRKVILGDYRLHQLSDSLVSLELSRSHSSNTELKPSVSYYPITLNLPEVFAPPLDLILGDSIYRKVNQHFAAWAKGDTNRSYNAAAYKNESKYAIPFCLSADSLILYPGAEGEMVALHRLAIALSDL